MPSKNGPSGRVSWLPLVAAYDTMRSAGLPDSAFTPELLEAVAQARSTHAFVRWETLITLMDQARAAWGTDERYMAACEHFDGAVQSVQGFAPEGMTVHQFCRMIVEGIDGAVYPDLALEVRELSVRCAEVEVHLPPEYPDSSSWLVGSVGAFRTMTRHLGLPPTEVEGELGTHHGIYRLTFPLGDRPSGANNPTVQAGHALTVINHLRDDLRRAMAGHPVEGSTRGKDLAVAWRLTERQAQVLRCVCRGLSNKEIALELACSVRTVELHVGKIFKKAGVESRNQLLARFANGG